MSLLQHFTDEIQNDKLLVWTNWFTGSKAMAEYGLDVVAKDHTDYVETEDPTVTNNFATVAFRFAHPMIQGKTFCGKGPHWLCGDW
jgi:hypothetical protein